MDTSHMPFTKIRLGGERFWVSSVVRVVGGKCYGIVQNNLIHSPYRVGDRIEFGEDQIIPFEDAA